MTYATNTEDLDHSTNPGSARKLLSCVLAGRNDNYMGNFKYRLGTCINYLSRNLDRIGRLDDVEVVVADWNSEVPLAKELPLTAEAARICRFVHVAPAVATRHQEPDRVFHGPCAVNVALARVRSEYAMMLGADILFPTRSLRNLLGLLDGEIQIPFPLDGCLFLCGRKRVPWDIVHREPSLDEWDEHLALIGGELEREQWWPGLGMSASALMMHSSLWRACRGFDEALPYWGWSDAELALRICQRYPWLELLNIGVVSFEMEHRSDKGAATAPPKQNEHKVHVTFEVNEQCWGLEGEALEIQTAEMILDEPVSAEPAAKADRIADWEQTRVDLLAEMTHEQVREHILSAVSNASAISDAEWPALHATAWYCLSHHPRRYAEYGIDRSEATAVVASACPAAEIYGISPWDDLPGSRAPSPTVQSGHIHALGYRGYMRMLTGDPTTALRRLQESLLQPVSFDLVLARAHVLGAAAGEQLAAIAQHLSAGGAIVFLGLSAAGASSAWDALQTRVPQLTYAQCTSLDIGLALAASLKGADRTQTVGELDLAAAWSAPPRRPGARILRRLRRAGARICRRAAELFEA